MHEDIRMINDASKEKDESHAGKVVERHWYDKNKHIFPASRWEVSQCKPNPKPFVSLLPRSARVRFVCCCSSRTSARY